MIFNLFEYRKNKLNGVEGINDKIEDSRIFRIRETSRHFYKKQDAVSVYLGVVVLRVWYFERALLQLKNCHHLLPEKTNPFLHLFAEPHS